MLVTCLCATWCLTCEAYRATFAAVQPLFPDVSFRWVDIEDESELVGEVDIKDFPTLLILVNAQVCFFGAVTPQPRVLEAMIAASVGNVAGQRDIPGDVEDLADRLAAAAPGSARAVTCAASATAA
jgi:thioredoxin 1